MKPPTARQIEVHAAVVRHGGSERRAAGELGVSYVTVHKTEMAYLNNTGETATPRPSRLPSPMEVARAIPERLDRIEANLAAIDASVGRLDGLVMELAAAVRELNARQPILLLERHVTHRRLSDGGEGGKRERGERSGR